MTYAWQQLTNSLPTAMNGRDGIMGCVLNGKMYAIGGWKSGTGLGTTYNTVLFSTDGITWTPSVKTPTWDGRHAFPVVVHNNRIYVLGGDINRGYYQPNVHSWDGLETSDWVVENTNAPWGNRFGHYAFSLNGYIYVGGGQTYTNITAPPTQFFKDLWRSTDGQTWELVTDDCPLGIRCFLGSVPVIDNEAFFIGGGTYETTDFPAREYKNDVFVMDVNHNFRCVSHGKNSVLTKLMYHNITVFDGKLWVIAGWAGSNQKRVFVSANKGETWTEEPLPPWAIRHAAYCVTYNNAIYFGTGWTDSDMWRLYDVPPPSTPPNDPKINLGSTPNTTTALASVYTVIDRSTALVAGKTVTEIGYHRMSAGSMTPKIFRQIGTSNSFDVVWSGAAVTHNGNGWQSFDIPDFVVPNNGSTYRIGFAFSYPYSDMYSTQGQRWLKAGNVTGNGVAFSYFTDGSCCMTWTEL